MAFEFHVPGKPQGKGRPKFARMGKFTNTYTPEKTASYENLIQVMALNEARAKSRRGEAVGAFRGAISVDLYMWFEPLKSFSKKKRAQALAQEIYPTKKPDIDNVIKVYLDALNNVLFNDDSQVIKVSAKKGYAETAGVVVIIKGIA